MTKNYIIVGGGFSAFIAQLLLKRKFFLFTPKSFADIKDFYRYKTSPFKIRKLFFRVSSPYTYLTSRLKNVSLHSIQKIGGSTNIWGGFINTQLLPAYFIRTLFRHKIILNKLSYKSTGCNSNSEHLYQMQSDSFHILNVAKYLKVKKNFLLHSMSINGSLLKLNFYSPSKPEIRKVFFCKKVILAVGVIDLIDLLYRSNFIKNSSTFELSEYSYARKIIFFKSMNSKFASGNKLIIRFNLLRALCHMFGIQKKLPLNNLFNLVPFYVEQHFSSRINKMHFGINNGNLVNLLPNDLNSKKSIFGESIHYCNLKINHIDINDFLKAIHPGLIGLGMAFVKQKKPGPISNDIVIDALKKLKDF